MEDPGTNKCKLSRDNFEKKGHGSEEEVVSMLRISPKTDKEGKGSLNSFYIYGNGSSARFVSPPSKYEICALRGITQKKILPATAISRYAGPRV